MHCMTQHEQGTLSGAGAIYANSTRAAQYVQAAHKPAW